MKVICISGKAGSGKDYTATYLKAKLEECDYRVLITHYGDLVKFVCTKFFDCNGEKDEAGRHLLQYVGTDIVRAQDQNYWVDFIVDVLKFFSDKWDYVLIPDCRFPNEIERLKENGLDVIHIHINRLNYDNGYSEERKNHISETALDNYPYDYELTNTGNKYYELTMDALTNILFDDFMKRR